MSEYAEIDDRRVKHDIIEMFDLIRAGQLEHASGYLRCFWSDDIKRVADHMGFQLLGQGSYSTVIAIPGDDTVIKLNHDMCDPWPHYAQFAKTNAASNPLLPKIFELYENQDNGMVIARVERLSKVFIRHAIGGNSVVKYLRNDLKTSSMSKRGIRNRALSLLQKEFDFGYKGVYSRINLAKIVIWIAELAMTDSGIVADFHGGNWMLRGNELVLNDPIA